jgi:hypothetical protein
MNPQLLIETAGWLDTAALLLAYGLFFTRWLAGDIRPYRGLNLVGGVLVWSIPSTMEPCPR